MSAQLGMVCAFTLAACGGGSSSGAPPAAAMGFTGTALVTDNDTVVATALTIDANLQNPWGIAFAPGSPFWISDNNNNLSTLYSGIGANETQGVTGSASVGVAIPASAAGVQAKPTGQVYNGSGGFMITTSMGQESALFIFDGEGGTIAAWAKDSGATAVTAYDDGVANGANHAVYKGLAIGAVGGATYLYATDLHNNKVDVFDTNFSKPAAMQGKFVDPNIPAGFAPFGIAALNGDLYVTFAQQDSAMHDENTGAGLGYVDIFDFSGNLISQFASAGPLNAPWGIAIAPAGFGSLQGDVLIGNFGDGMINIFTPNGTALASAEGPLMSSAGQPFVFPGLWSLVFGNGDSDKPVTTLFYTAGFANQTDGVFGGITLTSTPTPVGY
ncbi:MAG TPA: TIGR03118 family protein [Steroidobacteraceae bacterium]|nr:TIGR03118 family protein [Steroidobacteraceae bacterium]